MRHMKTKPAKTQPETSKKEETELVSIRLPAVLKQAVKEHVRMNDVTISQFARRAIRQELSRVG